MKRDKHFNRGRPYSSWYNMKSRCDNPNSHFYQHCGGLGITYCEEWKSYQNFKSWALSNGHKDNLTLERIDKTKDYSPTNCKWSNRLEQGNNKKNNKIITYKNKTQTFSQWARELGVKTSTLRGRLLTMSVEKAFSKKSIKHCTSSKYKRLWKIWYQTKKRCTNIKDKDYCLYGGNGITFYNEWLDYPNFEHWAFSNGYQETLCLSRKDTTKEYSPENCCWTTRTELNKNKINNVKIYYNNEVCCQSEVAKKLKISPDALAYRLSKNLPKEQVFYTGNLNVRKQEKEKTK